ncbi:MAG: SH3 domain-containing protein [Flavobacteriaceae bacterium]
MKKVVLLLAFVAIPFALFSCKEAPSNSAPQTETQVDNSEIPEQTLAMNAPNVIYTETGVEYRYVIAPSGLTLRAYNNLQSEKLGKMPYGTKVKVLTPEGKVTMTVSGVAGGMDEVEFNHKTGFAFNGFLSRYFPPERDISVKGYASELQKQFPEVLYSESVKGTASKPINIESLVLPKATWNEAYTIAQRLFDFPSEFEFPKPKGKDAETIFDGKPKKGIWVSQLEVSRKDNELQKIEYLYSSEKFNSKVTIEQDGDAMKLTRTEEVK